MRSHLTTISLLIFISLLMIFAPQSAQAAGSLFIAPSSASYTNGSTFTMTLVAGTDGQAINSAQATIAYSANLLDLVSVSRSGSVFTLWPVEPNGAAGSITFAGGVPTPGYTGNGGNIISATFRAKALGTATASVTSGQMLLNDGLGTNILGGYGAATWTIVEGAVAPPPPGPAGPAVLPAPTVSSPTHPNQETWYNKNTIILEWNNPEGALGWSYVYDDNESTTPDNTADTTETRYEFEDTSDGVAYFHIKVRNEGGWSDTTHFRLQIDTVAPEAFNIRLEGENPTGLIEPKIHFSTTDKLSGVSHYEILIDGLAPIRVEVSETSPYTLPELTVGRHEIQVNAIDKAGNIQSQSKYLEVVDRVAVAVTCQYCAGTDNTNYKFFLRWLISLLAILLVAVLILIVISKRRRDDDDDEQKSGH